MRPKYRRKAGLSGWRARQAAEDSFREDKQILLRIFRSMQGAPSARKRSVLPVRKRLSARSNAAECEKDKQMYLENSITQRSGHKKICNKQIWLDV